MTDFSWKIFPEKDKFKNPNPLCKHVNTWHTKFSPKIYPKPTCIILECIHQVQNSLCHSDPGAKKVKYMTTGLTGCVNTIDFKIINEIIAMLSTPIIKNVESLRTRNLEKSEKVSWKVTLLT